jgi:hypothetical protein
VNGLSSAISGVGTAIGRYFSLVSFIPSLFLVGFTFALIQSDAWSGDGTPDWAKAGDAFTHIGNLALLVLASIALGIIIHPIQVAMVQCLEGYWGTGRLAQRARAARMTHYLNRLNFLREDGPGALAGQEIQAAEENKKALGEGKRIRLVSKRDESVRLLSGYPGGYPGEYPNSDDDIMPTRLGNVLRAYERLAGYQYALDGVGVLRQIVFVAPQRHVDYLNDQRQLLDLSVRMCFTSLFASLISIAFLWHHGPWLAIALIPYAVAYISYRGAVVVAHEYGAAMSTIIDLDRFALYDYLKLPRPACTGSERKTNADLMELLRHNWVVDLKYEYPDEPSSTDKEQAATQSGE